MSFLNILFFAFLGGLILNLMPCVLPVISLKLFGLIKYQEENRAKILRHNVFYTLGVISTLMVLSLIIVAIKNTGQNVGWGFQLQSPLFVGVMILVLFVMALNLFGLFEFRTPGGKFFANVNIEDTFWGDFFSGALATILSTPCSAPFLGTALTFAFTASSFEIFITFIFIGLGLAFPFIITAVFPSTVKFLPKPGAWMEKLKYFLGLTLVMTVVWLLDVLHTLVDSQFLIRNFYTLVVSLFFLIFFYNKISKKFLWNLIGTVIVSYLFFSFATNYQKNEPQFVQAAETKEESAWTNFSPELIEDYLQSNELAFIDFTAKWCLTCQVNKKLVLERNSFYELINHRKIKLIRADWTRRDPIIGDWLAERGVVGIPAYYLIKDGELHYLGETISLSEIESFFN